MNLGELRKGCVAQWIARSPSKRKVVRSSRTEQRRAISSMYTIFYYYKLAFSGTKGSPLQIN
eukprot:3463-Heterococcus_DN1.PRE.1